MPAPCPSTTGWRACCWICSLKFWRVESRASRGIWRRREHWWTPCSNTWMWTRMAGWSVMSWRRWVSSRNGLNNKMAVWMDRWLTEKEVIWREGYAWFCSYLWNGMVRFLHLCSCIEFVMFALNFMRLAALQICLMKKKMLTSWMLVSPAVPPSEGFARGAGCVWSIRFWNSFPDHLLP